MSEHKSQLSSHTRAKRLLTDHFKCLDNFGDLTVSADLSVNSGYFRFGQAGICYGQCSSGSPAAVVTEPLHDACDYVSASGNSIELPFDPVQVVNNLYYERYRCNSTESKKKINTSSLARKLYYLARPLMSVTVRRHFQKHYFRHWDKIPFPVWPVDFSVERILEQLLIVLMKSQDIRRIPFIWFWPEGAPSCTVVTHDVETTAGMDFCSTLMDLNDSFDIKTAFQIIPENRYSVSQSFLDSIQRRGFEVNVHDLNHDGHLLEHREEFLRRAQNINRYGVKFGALGFRSALLRRNLDWFDALEFSYDMSVPNVAHLDPQRGGCCTVFPFYAGKLLELPVTMTQDYQLFHILEDYSITLWKEQASLIRERHGLMQFIIHPDYVIEKAAQGVYAELLEFLAELRAQGETWIALPREAASWWRLRSELRLVGEGGSLQIEGEGKERARIAYATLVDNGLTYEFDRVAGSQQTDQTFPMTSSKY